MRRIETIVVGLFVATLVPVAAFFGAWWSSVFLLPERLVPAAALGGLAIGLVLDVLFLRRWIRSVYVLPIVAMALLYAFLSLILLAVVMGVPVFQLGLGILAGLYTGRRLRHNEARAEQARRGATCASWFTAGVILLVSAVSATAACVSPSTPTDLQWMLGLSAPVAWGSIAALIVLGGLTLVVLQYWLTRTAVIVAYRVGRESDAIRAKPQAAP